jgi:tRNA dimethylallyltransferase
MGPTASGKTQLAMALAQHLPCDLISVDSAMVYRGMDIGTAKPTRAERAQVPHQLIDIVDAAHPYSAGQFCRDATQAIEKTLAAGRIPLLVGGTMLYFRALQQGLSTLPTANADIRAQIAAEAATLGWPALHEGLQQIDPVAAARISPHDAQRIARALEIYRCTGLSPTEAYQCTQAQPAPYRMINLGLQITDRAALAQRIEDRFAQMLQQGFVAEVAALKNRGDLQADMPSMRAVGYRQIWQYLAGEIDALTMQTQAIIATRQLAKRQMTWLRRWPAIIFLDAQQKEAALLANGLSVLDRLLK